MATTSKVFEDDESSSPIASDSDAGTSADTTLTNAREQIESTVPCSFVLNTTSRNVCSAFLEDSAEQMARNPWKYFIVSMTASILLSIIGFLTGNFTLSADNRGWLSRGTSIADTTTQLLLLRRHDRDLSSDNNSELWQDLLLNVQPGLEDKSHSPEKNDPNDPRFDGQNNSTVEDGFLSCEAAEL